MRGYGKHHLANKAFLTIPILLGMVLASNVKAEEQLNLSPTENSNNLTLVDQPTAQSEDTTRENSDISNETLANSETSEESQSSQLSQSELASSEVASSESQSVSDLSQSESQAVKSEDSQAQPSVALSSQLEPRQSVTSRIATDTISVPTKPEVSGSVAETPVVPSTPVTTASRRSDQLIIRYNRPIRKNEQIKVAVWSDKNAQDDIRWYTADKLGAAYIDLKNHRDYGKYHVHTYADRSSKMVPLTTMTLMIKDPAEQNKPASPQPKAVPQSDEIEALLKNAPAVPQGAWTTAYQRGDKMVVRYHLPIKADENIKVSTWSDKSGKSSLKWYDANAQGIAVVDLAAHGDAGNYTIQTFSERQGQERRLTTMRLEILAPSKRAQTEENPKPAPNLSAVYHLMSS